MKNNNPASGQAINNVAVQLWSKLFFAHRYIHKFGAGQLRIRRAKNIRISTLERYSSAAAVAITSGM
jgi:hypothetical protein